MSRRCGHGAGGTGEKRSTDLGPGSAVMVAESMPVSILLKGFGPHGDQHSTALGQAPPNSPFLIEEESFSTSLWRTLSHRAGSPPMVSEKRPAVFNPQF